MKQVETWTWKMRCETTGKVVRARWKMTAEEALARDPAAERLPGTMEMRTVYEPGEAPLHSTPPRWPEPF